MRNIAHEAGFRALDEQAEGRKNVVVLMPSDWGCIAFEMGKWPEGIWPRFSDKDESFKSLVIETLIIVGRDHDRDCVLLARERLRGIVHPRLVVIRMNNPEPAVFNHDECFEEAALTGIEFK